MKFLLSILLITSSFGDLDRIAKINKLKKEAKKAYQTGNYANAITKYHYLLDTMQVNDDRIRLNLANAYYQSNDTTNALDNYGAAIESNLKAVKSIAYQQTGIIQHQQKKYKEALDSFKYAIKSDPSNEAARFNYEMLKKLLKEQEKNQNQNDNKDQENKDQNKEDQNKEEQQDKENKEQEDKKDQEQKDKEGEGKKDKEQKDKEGKEDKEKKDEEEKGQKEEKEGEEKDDLNEQEQMAKDRQEKLKEMNISEEKAKMILEALKNQEVQYIQQNRKKANEKPKSNKPDW